MQGFDKELGSTRLNGPPECELREVERHTTRHGCTLVGYIGEDGDTYHEFIGPVGTIWLVMRASGAIR
jgi:hypothetical protein